ncbi:hypothetical protein ACIA5H_37685 [Nocardia sp. NPDC051900]|uniref:hypothetical protein n=1 Tax=Nocardia sp. NPDC051900 TaxID=3364326 RepID=UPI00379E6F6E
MKSVVPPAIRGLYMVHDRRSLSPEAVAQLGGNALAGVKEFLKAHGADELGPGTLIIGIWIEDRAELLQVQVRETDRGQFGVTDIQRYEP